MARRLFVPDADLTAASLIITGPDHHHIVNVLRMEISEQLVLLDNRGGAVLARLSRVEKRECTAEIVGPVETSPEPAVHVTVAQAIGKGDRFEQVIQHGTEIGASSFIPMITERTVVRLDMKECQSKVARWQAVAKGAAEQCGRSRMPGVEMPAQFPAVLQAAEQCAHAWLLDQNGSAPNGTVAGACIALVGPEGGFSPSEVQAARDRGVQVLSLGQYTLRTETAALVALSRILG